MQRRLHACGYLSIVAQTGSGSVPPPAVSIHYKDLIMPGYKAHLAGGAAVAGGALGGLLYCDIISASPLTLAALFSVALLATMFPDTDTESKGQNLFYAIMATVDVVLILNKEYEWAALLGLFAMLPALGKHRGWTHSWWAMLIVPLPLILLPMAFYHTPWEASMPFYLAAVTGYGTHLVLDALF
jgi:membrane-bound metal-dependent hydrolase YbcI (DUF457 family)